MGKVLNFFFCLQEEFKRKANVRIKKKDSNSAKLNENIRIRHCGILGLCAFINSSPYDVPDCVPEIFFILGNHLNDPQPIPVSFTLVKCF